MLLTHLFDSPLHDDDDEVDRLSLFQNCMDSLLSSQVVIDYFRDWMYC